MFDQMVTAIGDMAERFLIELQEMNEHLATIAESLEREDEDDDPDDGDEEEIPHKLRVIA